MGNLDFYAVDLESARKLLADARTRETELWDKAYGEPGEGEPRGFNSDTPVRDEDAKEELETARNDLKRMRDVFLANPALRPHVRAFMVDVHGEEPTLTEKDMEAWRAEPGSPLAMIAGKSRVARVVRDFIDGHGFTITDSGGGCCGWHVGSPNTRDGADELCDLLYENFKPLIDEGVLLVEVHLWSMKLVDLNGD